MQPPRTPAPAATAAARPPPAGRALGSMAAALGRGLARIDARLVAGLDSAYDERGRDVARLEAALLVRLRRGLAPYMREAGPATAPGDRIDAVLADGLLEAVDAALATVTDLEGEPPARMGRLLAFCQELLAELVALGAGDVAVERRTLSAFKERLQASQNTKESGHAQLAGQLGALFAGLAARLEQHSPLRRPTLLDEVLRGAERRSAPPGR